MEIYIDQILQIDSEFNRDWLLNLSRDSGLGANVSVVYIYSLLEQSIPYPLKNGSHVYIGESCRIKNATGIRFGQHISSGEFEGKNRNTNFTLSKYYWSGRSLRLRIYKVSAGENKKIESSLLIEHLNKYGAYPIAQGASCNKTTYESVCKCKSLQCIEGAIENA